MNRGESFINAVKRVRFPAAHQFEASDFDEFFAKKELLPLLECFSSLTESNVLTTEEILEFQALTPSEKKEIDELHKKHLLSDIQEVESKKREINFLEEQLSLIERQSTALEKQREQSKLCESKVFEENDYAEKKLVQAKQKFHAMEITAISETEEKLFSMMISICETVKELKSLMTSDLKDNILSTTTAFKDQLNQFLEIEKKLSSHVKVYFQNNFQNQHENSALAFDAKLKSDIEEILFLKTRLKAAKLKKLKSMSESKKMEAIIKCWKKYDGDFFHNLPNVNSQLRKLEEEASECNEKHQQKEKELYSYLTEAVCDHIDAQCSNVGLSIRENNLSEFQCKNDKVLLPMKALLHQRIRLEQLIFNSSLYYNTLLDLEELIKNTSDWLGQEARFLALRKEKCNQNLKEESNATEYLLQDPVLLSLHKILVKKEELESLDVSHVSLSDVLKQVESLKNESDNQAQLLNKHMQEVESAVKYKDSIEIFFSGEHKDYPGLGELDRNINVNLNNLSIKIARFQAKFLKLQEEFNQKKKILDRKKNLSLQRKLFVYALNDEKVFEKSIEDIKKAMEKNEKVS